MENERLIMFLKQRIKKSFENGEVGKANELLRKHKYEVIQDIEFCEYLGKMYFIQNILEEASYYISYGLNKEPFNYNLLMLHGDLMKKNEDHINALSTYRKAHNRNFRTKCVDEAEKAISDLKSVMISEKNEKYWMAYLEKILVIDYGHTEDLKETIWHLVQYGIEVDMATASKKYRERSHSLGVFGKLIDLENTKSIVEYSEFYQYDLIYALNVPEEQSKEIQLNYPRIIVKEALDLHEIKKAALRCRPTPEKAIDFSYQDNFTIALFTLNRPNYFEKILQSFTTYKQITPKIIILDSSNEVNMRLNQESLKKMENLRSVEYFHFHPDTTFSEKIKFALNHIESEYFAFSPDDDFFTEEGLVCSLKFLYEHHDYYTVKGRCLAFVEGHKTLLEYDKPISLSSDDVSERLKTYVSSFASTFMYQVFRTSNYKHFMKFNNENEGKLCENDVLLEYCTYFMHVITGKIGKINIDLNIRDKGVEREFEARTLKDSVKDNTFNENYAAFKKGILRYCDYINTTITETVIEEVFTYFMTRTIRIPMEYLSKKDDKYDMELLMKGFEFSWTK